MFIRSKVVKGRTYYQLIEGFRDREIGDKKSRVRHRALAALGTEATIEGAIARKRRGIKSKEKRLALAERYPTARMEAEARSLRWAIESLARELANLESLLIWWSIDTTAGKGGEGHTDAQIARHLKKHGGFKVAAEDIPRLRLIEANDRGGMKARAVEALRDPSKSPTVADLADEVESRLEKAREEYTRIRRALGAIR